MLAWIKVQREGGEIDEVTLQGVRDRLQKVIEAKEEVNELARVCLQKAAAKGRLPSFEDCTRIILQWPCIMSMDEATQKCRSGVLYPYGARARIESYFWYGRRPST